MVAQYVGQSPDGGGLAALFSGSERPTLVYATRISGRRGEPESTSGQPACRRFSGVRRGFPRLSDAATESGCGRGDVRGTGLGKGALAGGGGLVGTSTS